LTNNVTVEDDGSKSGVGPIAAVHRLHTICCANFVLIVA